MAEIMNLPKLGVNMEKATIVDWFVQVGESVEKGQHLFDAETDKAIQEIHATTSGILAKILAQPGETVQCGQPVAAFVEAGEELPEDFVLPTAGQALSQGAPVFTPREPPLVPGPPPIRETRHKISPLGKRLAKELGVDYTRLQPSKPGRRLVKADILAFAGKHESLKKQILPPLPSTPALNGSLVIRSAIPLTGVRKIIADRMATSARTAARAALFVQVDMTQLKKWREQLKQSQNEVSYNSLFVAIAAKALREHPEVNARIAGEEIQWVQNINVGLAVDTPRGLLVPTIHHADQKGVLAIEKELQEKISRARAGKSILDDLSAGTFTITNLGMFDIEGFIPIINPPECAILGIGSILRQAVVIGETDRIEVRPLARLCLAWDHRILDGAPAARFLRRIKELAEWPLGLFAEKA